MQPLKVSTRLFLLIGLSAVLLLAVGATGLWGAHRTKQSLQTVYDDRVMPLVQLSDIQRRQFVNQLILMDEITRTGTRDPEAAIAQVKANIAEIDKLWKAYMATYLTPEEERLAKGFIEARGRFVADGLKPTMQALRAGDTELARNCAARMEALFADTRGYMKSLLELQEREAAKEFESAKARYETVFVASLAVLGLGLAALLAVGLAIARSLLRELGAEPAEAAALARRVAEGDLTQPVALRAGDDRSLMASLASMQQSLRHAVSEVRRNADSVATASGEIAQGNLDLSQRTEEQASALQQTAASMEQLTHAVRQNADHARQASQLTQGASDVAQRSGQAVGELVTTMRGLNESSHRIAEIAGVIDGIAFQTNILALNAAVEAARAGEQGRGFAVVASEVRSLAKRSAESARDVKALIGDSVTRIEAGGAVAEKAGQTVGEVVTAIARVNDLVREISAASQEQGAGIEQVGRAVSQMDQVTQQNAALVEESSAAADSLRQQAGQLQAAVQVFRVDADLPAAAATAAWTAPKAAVAKPVAPAWDGTERRGPHRAQNVVRPTFQRATPQAGPARAAGATGTDDQWTAF